MGLIQRALGAWGYERRSDPNDPSWAALGGNLGYASALSARAAENLSTVLACTTAISSALGFVPACVYRRDPDGTKTELTAHPLAKLSRLGANPNMTWPDFVEHWVASALLSGNGLAEIVRGGNGQLAGLNWIPWQYVTVVYLSTGRLAFDVSDGRGNSRRLLQSEVIHLRGRTDDGLVGRSVLSRAADTVSGVNSAQTIARKFMDNGLQPSCVFESVHGLINAETRGMIREAYNRENQGVERAGNALILGGGLTYKGVSLSPEDAELLESRKFGVVEICRLFHVPPPIVQAYENNTFTNANQAGIWFATYCLGPWARKIQAEFARSVLPPGVELELDLSGFLQGDPATRWATHQIAIQTGVLSTDEVRQIEGYNARGGASPQ